MYSLPTGKQSSTVKAQLITRIASFLPTRALPILSCLESVVIRVTFVTASTHAVLAPRARIVRLAYYAPAVPRLRCRAHSEEYLPEFNSELIELCTFQHYARDVKYLPEQPAHQMFLARVARQLRSRASALRSQEAGPHCGQTLMANGHLLCKTEF